MPVTLKKTSAIELGRFAQAVSQCFVQRVLSLEVSIDLFKQLGVDAAVKCRIQLNMLFIDGNKEGVLHSVWQCLARAKPPERLSQVLFCLFGWALTPKQAG